MADELQIFRSSLNEDVDLKSRSENKLPYEAFFEICTEKMAEAGRIQSADLAHYQRRGLAIDGYSLDNTQEGITTLSLLITDFMNSEDTESLTRTDMNAHLRRLSQFIEKSFDAAYKAEMNEVEPAYALMNMIEDEWDDFYEIRAIVVTNKLLSQRIDSIEGDVVKDKTIINSVIDIEQLYEMSTKGREAMVINLEEDFGQPWPALPGYSPGTSYNSYMTLISGTQLADIYKKWGDRLLEQNVRVFLQARSNVNKGLRTTLREEPEMFFSYNNGISATAEEVVTTKDEDGLKITSLTNFQIVNGGQTTGSIFFAAVKDRYKDQSGNMVKPNLDKVFVQVKLSVITPDRTEEIVPRISQYSNTQNSVNDADLSANHAFYQRIEQLSRSTPSPLQPGEARPHKWFFERSRGSYRQNRSNSNASALRRFELEYPKKFYFDKLMLAKALAVWEDIPQQVSKGAQEAFKRTHRKIHQEWADTDEKNSESKNDSKFNELFYQELIAKIIIFKETESLISNQPWYGNAYRANFVAYTIAKLSHDLKKAKKQINFKNVWEEQGLSGSFRDVLDIYSTHVKDVILNPSKDTTLNITQWAKRDICWDRVKELDIPYPDTLDYLLVSKEEYSDQKRQAAKNQKVDSSINNQFLVIQQDPELWIKFLEWGHEYGMVSEKVRSILGKVPQGNVSSSQCKALVDWVQHLQSQGCPYQLKID